MLFALLVVCQSVLDISGELAGRRGIRFQDFTGAVRTLAHIEGFSPALVDSLALLAGFRDILVHEYIEIDYARVIAAVERLEPVDEFIAIVGRLERGA